MHAHIIDKSETEYVKNECIKSGIEIPDILKTTTVMKPSRVKGSPGYLLCPPGIISKNVVEAGFGNGSVFNNLIPHESAERQKPAPWRDFRSPSHNSSVQLNGLQNMKSQAGSHLGIILDVSSEDIRNQSHRHVNRGIHHSESSLRKSFSNKEDFLAFRVSPIHHSANIETCYYYYAKA